MKKKEIIERYGEEEYQRRLEYQKQYDQKHREESREYDKQYRKQYYQQHREQIRERVKKYREQHREQIREKSKQYREQHGEEYKKYQKQYQIQYREQHREEIKEQQKQYNKKHRYMFAYCIPEQIEEVENYEFAKKDNFKGWCIHHRLETHNSDGQRRLVNISREELDALDMYYNRPANELIFLTISEHMKLHRNSKANTERP